MAGKSGAGTYPIWGTGWFLNLGATDYNDTVSFGCYQQPAPWWGGFIGFGATGSSTGYTMGMNGWVHLQICRQGTRIYTHLNGSPRQGVTVDPTFSMERPGTEIGTIELGNMNGYMEDFYINRGYAEVAERSTFSTASLG